MIGDDGLLVREGVEMEAFGIVGQSWFHQCNAEQEDVVCNEVHNLNGPIRCGHKLNTTCILGYYDLPNKFFN